MVLANPQSYSVKLNFSEEAIALSSNGPEIGDAEDFVEIVEGGFDGSIIIDGDLLLTTLGRTPTETIEIEYASENKPMFVKSTSDDIENLHTTVIMSMQVTG